VVCVDRTITNKWEAVNDNSYPKRHVCSTITNKWEGVVVVTKIHTQKGTTFAYKWLTNGK